MNCEASATRRNRVSRTRRAFTLLELAVASVIFLLAAGALSLVVTQVISTNALSSEQVTIQVALSNAANQIITSPGAYSALLDNTFSVPSACGNQSGTGTAVQSCLSVNNANWYANWGIELGPDAAATSSATAAYLTLTGRVVLADGTVIQVSRIVNAPSYAYAGGQGVVRVQVSDPGHLFSGSIYLLSYANPSTVVTSGSVSNGVVLLRANAASCTNASPCVLGLTAGNNYATYGTASLPADEVSGQGAQIVLSAGESTDAALDIQGVGTGTLSLMANNLTTGQVGTAPEIGSVCLYANFNDGVAQQSVPVCNFIDPGTIFMTSYAPDPSRPSVRVSFPAGVPITLSTDPSSGVCPYVTNPSGSTGLVGWNGTGWVSAGSGVCTSWTWGNPSSWTVGMTTQPWGTGSITLVDGSATPATITWAASGASNDLYVADYATDTLREVTATGVVTTTSAGAPGTPGGLTEDSSGDVYMSAGNAIYIVTPGGTESLVAGAVNTAGNVNGTGSSALFNQPHGLVLNGAGTILYVADSGNSEIRAIRLADDSVSTLGVTGLTLSYPNGMTMSPSGSLIVADESNCRIVSITTSGTGSVLAGSPGNCGLANGPGGSAEFDYPQGVAVDSSGNIYVADSSNNLIREITSSGSVSTLAGSGAATEADGTGTSASLNYPTGITWMGTGLLYVTDENGQTIRTVSTSGGVVSTLAGSAGSAGEANGSGTSAQFYNPVAITSGAGIWSSSQPAVGFGTEAVWSMPRDMGRCAGGCISLGNTVPENTACPGQACDSADVAYLTGPDTGGMNTILVSGATGTTVSFSLSAVDYFGHSISATVVTLPQSGTLENGSGVPLGTGASIGSTPGGGGAIPMEWVEGSSKISQVWFTVALSNGVSTVHYQIGLYRSVAAWQISGYGTTISQGASGTLNALITNIDGTAASTDSVSFSCANCPSGVTFSPNPVTSESGGVASVGVSVSSSATSGTYVVSVSAGGQSSAARLTIAPVAASLSVSLGESSAQQGDTTSATVLATDGAGNPMKGVDVALVSFQGTQVAPGVYAPNGGCITGSDGTCTATLVVQAQAQAGTYSVDAESGSLSASAALSVSQAPATITASNVNATAGGPGILVSVNVTDGAGAPVPSAAVIFLNSSSDITLSANGAVTNAAGVAQVTLTVPSTTPTGNYTITAVAGSASTSITVTVQ
jgi:sugar lactone lactonase YvrE/5-hydroxyisourate hydrolase-like protein (transthyretin family)